MRTAVRDINQLSTNRYDVCEEVKEGRRKRRTAVDYCQLIIANCSRVIFHNRTVDEQTMFSAMKMRRVQLDNDIDTSTLHSEYFSFKFLFLLLRMNHVIN